MPKSRTLVRKKSLIERVDLSENMKATLRRSLSRKKQYPSLLPDQCRPPPNQTGLRTVTKDDSDVDMDAGIAKSIEDASPTVVLSKKCIHAWYLLHHHSFFYAGQRALYVATDEEEELCDTHALFVDLKFRKNATGDCDRFVIADAFPAPFGHPALSDAAAKYKRMKEENGRKAFALVFYCDGIYLAIPIPGFTEAALKPEGVARWREVLITFTSQGVTVV